MRTRSLGIIAVALFALAGVVAVVTGAPTAIRVLFTVPLVLVLPGYALSQALNRSPSLGGAQRVAEAVGLSLAVAAVGGVVLNVTPWGLQASSWAALLAAVTAAGAAAALARRRGAPSPVASAVPRRLPVLQGSLLSVAVVIAALAGVVAWQGAANQKTPGFTQFWLQPAATAGTVQVGLVNEEASTVTYRVDLWAGGRVVDVLQPIKVAAGARWDTRAAIGVQTDTQQPIRAELYRLDKPGAVYREASLWPVGTGG